MKILGIIDIIAGIIFVFGLQQYLFHWILILGGIVFLIKSTVGMYKDFASWVDLSGGLIFFLAIFVSVPSWVSLALGIFIGQKGIYSLF